MLELHLSNFVSKHLFLLFVCFKHFKAFRRLKLYGYYFQTNNELKKKKGKTLKEEKEKGGATFIKLAINGYN